VQNFVSVDLEAVENAEQEVDILTVLEKLMIDDITVYGVARLGVRAEMFRGKQKGSQGGGGQKQHD